MANGQEPYCVTCWHFASDGGNVREPSAHCRCTLHRVKLPLAQTDRWHTLLICRDWRHHQSGEGWSGAEDLPAGKLCAYGSLYAREFVELASMDSLPSLES